MSRLFVQSKSRCTDSGRTCIGQSLGGKTKQQASTLRRPLERRAQHCAAWWSRRPDLSSGKCVTGDSPPRSELTIRHCSSSACYLRHSWRVLAFCLAEVELQPNSNVGRHIQVPPVFNVCDTLPFQQTKIGRIREVVEKKPFADQRRNHRSIRLYCHASWHSSSYCERVSGQLDG